MLAIASRRADPNKVVDVSPSSAVDIAPAPNSGEKRLLSLWVGERVTRFAVRLRANARWVKQFLHGGPRHDDIG